MSHEVSVGNHPSIVVVRYFGDIEANDIIIDPGELHLNEGQSKYLLIDTNEANPVVPEGMWERVHKSIIDNENLIHIAIHVKSAALRILMGAVLKLTRQRNRVSLHQSYEEAEAQILKVIKST